MRLRASAISLGPPQSMTRMLRLFLDAAKSSGFLDYKRLLETYFLAVEGGRVNFFDLLVENLLQHSELPNGRMVGEVWALLQASIPERNMKKAVGEFESQVADFNAQLDFKLKELVEKTTEILEYFKFELALEFQCARSCLRTRGQTASWA